MSDLVLSFMWAWSGVLIRLLVFEFLGLRREPIHEIVKIVISLANTFFFAFLGKITNGGAFNPLAVLPNAISGDFENFLYCVGARIPAQVSLFVLFFSYWKSLQ